MQWVLLWICRYKKITYARASGKQVRDSVAIFLSEHDCPGSVRKKRKIAGAQKFANSSNPFQS